MQKISVVIPVYNAQESLKELFERLKVSLGTIAGEFEIIMVEDCSRDRSWEVIEELARKDKRVKGIRLSKNFGQHNALLCGIRAACHETVVTIDDDLQNPPEEIPKLVDKLNEGYDVVYGRPKKEQHGLLRNLASALTKIVLQNSMGAETARSISAFRAFRTDIRKAFCKYYGTFVSLDVLLTWGASKFVAIPVEHHPRKVGTSNYTLRKLVAHSMNMVTGFSILPLQLASLTGFLLTFFGLGILVYVVGRWVIQGSVVPGFAFLASIIAIFSGAQLFSLGMMGEYLARIHFRTMKKPPYVIKSTAE